MEFDPGAPTFVTVIPSTNLKYAHFTPNTIKSDLDASSDRASRRKAEYERERAVKRQKALSSGSPTPPEPKNKGGRPRTAHLNPRIPQKGSTILKKSKPVKTWIDMDAWQWIFEFCSLEFLLKARTVCSGFRHALQSPLIWQKARLNHYGPSHPPCPPTLTEMQYADLLTGLGCQAKGCNNKKARKTYWAFQRRWCDACLHNQVLENEAADQMFSPYLQHYRGCVPQAVFDSWRHYQWIGSPLDIPNWARMQAFTTPGYSLYDLKELKSELDAFTAPAPDGTTKSFEQIVAFFDGKREANAAIMGPLRAVENFVKEAEKARLEDNRTVKAQRADFYAKMAAKMVPPVDRTELENLVCFKKAVAILRPANDRSWFVLKPKIREEMKMREEEAAKLRTLQMAAVLENGRAGDMGARPNMGARPDLGPPGLFRGIEDCAVIDIGNIHNLP